MFTTFRRGWGFFRQSIAMARDDRDLIKPSIYSFFANIAVTIIIFIPMVVLTLVLGWNELGNFILYILGALLLVVQYTVSYIFSGMTAYLVYGYLAEGDGRMDKAWAIVKRDFFDLISLAIASAIVKTIENILRGQRGRRGGALAGIMASILRTVWTTATYFVLPAMVIEDLNLKQGLKRATQIIKDNFLLVAISEIGVGAVTGLVSFVVIVLAVVLALAIFIPLSAAAGGAGLVIGAILGGLVFGVAIAFVTVFSTYINTAYHTTMFIWATNMEKAANEGESAEVVPIPVPLAAVLPG